MLQAALDRVHGYRLERVSVSGGDQALRPVPPGRNEAGAALPLDGRPWTDEQRSRVQAALAELKAVRLASATVASLSTVESVAPDYSVDVPVACPAEGVAGGLEAVCEAEALGGQPELPKQTMRSHELDGSFIAAPEEVSSVPAAPDEPVLVQQGAPSGPPQEFALPMAPARARPRWYGSSEVIEVHGLRLPGLVRVAQQPPPKGAPLHPATIAAWMPAETSALADLVEPLQDAWAAPTFSSLTPAQRGLYLRWLASGRSFDVPPRLALLFIYNLESRVVVEGLRTLADDERREMTLAAHDLVKRFGAALPMLRSHGLSLTGFLQAPGIPERLYLTEAPELPESFETPALLQVAIGQAVRDGASLPWDWALASVLSNVCVPKRTPVGRCREELKQLFAHHFERAFPRGLKVQGKPSTTLTVHYRGLPDQRTGSSAVATESIASAAQASLGESQTAALRQIVDKCADQLSAYSRFVGRVPNAIGSPDAEARLPPALLRQRVVTRLKSLAERSSGRKEASLDQAWMELWGRLPERKDSGPFLRALLEAEGFTIVASAPLRTGASSESAPSGREFQLDKAKLEKVQQDDAAASVLLAALFAEPAEQDAVHDPAFGRVAAGRSLFPALDEDHFSLLTKLIEEEGWSLERLQGAASQLGLMLDGALEVINDAVFDLAGGPLVVDHGGLEVDVAALQALRLALATPS